MSDYKTHLSRDPIMKTLVDKHQIKEYWGGQSDYFLDLTEIVTGQQLSMKAADAIFKRLLGLFPDKPTPKQILTLSADQLRAIGYSRPKASYLHNIALAVEKGSLPIDQLDTLTDDKISTAVTAIKGLGPWSAEMFLMFSLKRPDIFSVGDLGIRTAISRLYHLDREDKPAIIKLSENWRPFRTYACRYLWASLDSV